MPHESESCDHLECPVWRASEWSACSVNCGKGIKTRVVQCILETKNRALRGLESKEVEKSKCDSLLEPSSSMECLTSKVCPEWRFTQWTSCSVTCGKGYQMRYVYCSEKGSLECSSKTRPSNSEICNMPACSYTWKIGEWSEVYIYIFASRFLFY